MHAMDYGFTIILFADQTKVAQKHEGSRAALKKITILGIGAVAVIVLLLISSLVQDGSFERLLNDSSPHGNYDIFVVNSDGTGEARLTESGYSQGLASWSHSGDRIVYIIAAIGTEGKYDIHIMNSDGANSRNITPDYFPSNFLCHSPTFSPDDSKIFFIGEWWE